MGQDSARGTASQLLDGRIVLVTGVSSGIGRAIAHAAATAGANLALVYRANRDGADSLANEIRALGRKAVVVQADVGSPDDVAKLVQVVQKEFGRVDAWINNAGADILTGPGAQLNRLEKLDTLLKVDLRGTMLASWAAAEMMAGQSDGTIINMSWDGVLRGFGGENPELYAAAKGGVLGFSRSLALSLAPRIRVNVLGPGWIATSFGESAHSFRERIEQRIPLGRWGTPEDVAGAAVYLASGLAGYVTGQMILVNGGDVM